MKYKTAAKVSLVISVLCIGLVIFLDDVSYWGGFFAFLIFGVLLNKLGEKE